MQTRGFKTTVHKPMVDVTNAMSIIYMMIMITMISFNKLKLQVKVNIFFVSLINTWENFNVVIHQSGGNFR